MTAAISSELYARALFAEQRRGLEDRKSSWRGPASLLLAAAIHVVLLIQFGSLIKPDVPVVHRQELLQVELVNTAVANEAPKKVIPEPEKPTVNPAPQPPTPVVKPKPAHVKKPVKHRRKIVRPAPSAQQTAKITRQVEPSPVQTPPMDSPPTIQQAVPVRDFRAEQDQLNRLRKQYLAAIMSAIEAHKIYPYSARRRHLQGNIDISFMIDSSGQISDIRINGKFSTLKASSMDALQDSRPFPPLPKEMTTPIRFHCIMKYQLNR